MGALWALVWLATAVLTVVAALRLWTHLRAHVDPRPTLDDAAIREILDTGVYVSEEDEPIDLDSVHEEERRFWEEAEWDDVEEV